MALQFTTIEEPSFARGIDARSSENQIRDGFVRDLVNADIVEGRVTKRKGYVDYTGKIPFRVVSYRQENNTPVGTTDRLYFTFDTSVDLSRLTSSPLLVYGRSSNIPVSGSNPFTVAGDTFRYYTEWFSNITKTIPACGPAPTYTPAIGSLSAPLNEHNIPSTDIFVNTGIKPFGSSATSLTNTQFLPEATINNSTYEITIPYTNGDIEPKPTFVFYKDGRTIVGETYSHAVTLPIAGPNPYTITINQATHQLNSSDIRYQLYKKVGPTWVSVKADVVTINQSSSEVSLTLVGPPAELNGDYKVLLATVPVDQATDFTYTGSNIVLTDISSPFVLYTLYSQSGSTLTEILPDEVVYDDTAKTLTIAFSPTVTGLASMRLHYDYGSVRANELYVDSVDEIGATLSDPTPQLTVYGLDHATAYGNEKEVDRRGWVTHLDSYRSPSTTHMVAGLGGNLFAALRRDQMVTREGTALPMAEIGRAHV